MSGVGPRCAGCCVEVRKWGGEALFVTPLGGQGGRNVRGLKRGRKKRGWRGNRAVFCGWFFYGAESWPPCVPRQCWVSWGFVGSDIRNSAIIRVIISSITLLGRPATTSKMFYERATTLVLLDFPGLRGF